MFTLRTPNRHRRLAAQLSRNFCPACLGVPQTIRYNQDNSSGKATSPEPQPDWKIVAQQRFVDLRSTAKRQNQQLVQSLSHKLDALGARVNEVTGYNDVELLKAQVRTKEDELRAARGNAKLAKAAYDISVSSRATAQSDVNSLLERKHSWTDADVSRFTTLVRADHSANAAVAENSANLASAEIAVDQAFDSLTQAILRRYHEEQIWSDKIRSISTWLGIAGLVINLVVFVGAIAFVEPWKRKKMVERIEERSNIAMSELQAQLGVLTASIQNLQSSPTQEQSPLQELSSRESTEDPPETVTSEIINPWDTTILSSFPWLTERLSPILRWLSYPSFEREMLGGLLGSAFILGVVRIASWSWS